MKQTVVMTEDQILSQITELATKRNQLFFQAEITPNSLSTHNRGQLIQDKINKLYIYLQKHYPKKAPPFTGGSLYRHWWLPNEPPWSLQP